MPMAMQQCRSTRSGSSFEFHSSDAYSERSTSPAPTYDSPSRSTQSNFDGDYFQHRSYDDQGRYTYYDYASKRASAETSASTATSVENFMDDLPSFDVPDNYFTSSPSIAIASTPREFAKFFPSTKKLFIKHDDATDDGNMNLRVDTSVTSPNGGKIDLTLFHLRMHDLKRREFSLRRYCRDSGKEVCRSSQTYMKPSALSRPTLQRSMSNALSSLRSKAENKSSTVGTLRRQDSGYDSMSEDSYIEESTAAQEGRSFDNNSQPSNAIKLEFSNYAHLDVRRRGGKSPRRYEFDYWGTRYAWKREITRSGSSNETSYYLVDLRSSRSIAHILPVTLSDIEAREEEAKGGWISPCSMWISDESIMEKPPDIADVIIASGLIALVDDSIKRRWHGKSHLQLTMPNLPRSFSKMDMDYFSPKRLIDEIFNRREMQASRHPTPLRQKTM